MPSPRFLSWTCFGLVLAGALLSSACSKTRERGRAGASAGSAETASVIASASAPPIAAPSGSACEGPVFDFGSQDRLRWGTEGVLVQREHRYGIDLGRKVRFHTAQKGDAITGAVELTCTSCSTVERAAFAALLASMIGKRVRATGTLEPGWTQVAATPVEVPLGVRLSVASADVALVK